MKKSEIIVGGYYVAKVSGRLVTVRVDAIRDDSTMAWRRNGSCTRTFYNVTNLTTGRKTTFRSAAKFRCKSSENYYKSGAVQPDLLPGAANG